MKTPDEPRYCITCGKLLVRRPGEQCNNFKRRKTCGNLTTCHKKAVSKGLRDLYYGNDIPFSEDNYYSQYKDPRDAEQAKINKRITLMDAKRRGLGKDKGRVLPKTEVLRLIESGTLLTAGRSAA